jgi:hypothetical protein
LGYARSLLLPGGMLSISLYSQAARENINKIRQYVKDLEIPASLDGIRTFRNALMTNELETTLSEDTLRLNDLSNISGCRDLFFHVQEHQMTIP